MKEIVLAGDVGFIGSGLRSLCALIEKL